MAGGVALACSFQTPNIAGLAWVGPALILFAARGGHAFRLGYLAGFTHYLVSLSWLLHITNSVRGGAKVLPVLGWMALAAYLALYPALWTWLCASDVARTWRARTLWALFCAVAWVAMEMAVARMLTGFPWNLLGASQQKLLPLLQIASWTGVYGVAFLVVWFSASLRNTLLAFLERPAARSVWLRELALPVAVCAACYAFGLHRMTSATPAPRTLRVALVQPSIPQTSIWNPAEADARFAQLLELTAAALTNKVDLLIWPEGAVPKLVRDDVPTQRAIARLAASNNVWIIIGSDDYDLRGTNELYYNSSFLVSPRGELVSTYRKRRLVIFGEYIPLFEWFSFMKYLTPITGGFTAGERPVTFDLDSLRAKTSVLICFEDVFPHYAREHAAEDVDFLVNITNDGWFGESAAQWQQAACAALRAVENGLPLVRCANNGISCWIDRFGALHNTAFDDSTDVYRAGFKIVTVPIAAARPRTFYNQHGDWFGWGCVGITIAVLAGRVATTRRKK